MGHVRESDDRRPTACLVPMRAVLRPARQLTRACAGTDSPAHASRGMGSTIPRASPDSRTMAATRPGSSATATRPIIVAGPVGGSHDQPVPVGSGEVHALRDEAHRHLRDAAGMEHTPDLAAVLRAPGARQLLASQGRHLTTGKCCRLPRSACSSDRPLSEASCSGAALGCSAARPRSERSVHELADHDRARGFQDLSTDRLPTWSQSGWSTRQHRHVHGDGAGVMAVMAHRGHRQPCSSGICLTE